MSNLYTVKQTADILGFSTNTVYKYLAEGYIKAARSDSKQGRFRITKSSIEEFLGEKLSDIPNRTIIATQTPEELDPAPVVTSSDEVTPPTLIVQSTPLSVKMTRWLILISLLLIIGDLFRSEGFSYWHQTIRLVLISIFVLIAYQYGGVNNKNKGIKDYRE